jgi:hypothetical protein
MLAPPPRLPLPNAGAITRPMVGLAPGPIARPQRPPGMPGQPAQGQQQAPQEDDTRVGGQQTQ